MNAVIVLVGITLKNATVLVVDDDEVMRDLISCLLEDHVRGVVVAGSVDEAMDLVIRVRPGLLVSDICMPGDDGYELIRRVRSSVEGRATRAVALSAYSEDACRDAALASGYDMFLRKPVDANHFVAVLQALLHD